MAIDGDRYRRTPAIMHSIDRHGRIEEVSDLWLERFGYAREAVLGRPSTDFLTEESRRYAVEEVLPEFFRTGRCSVVYDFLDVTGDIVPVRLTAVAEVEEGEFVRSLAVLDDLTEHRLLEARLLDAQKLESLAMLAGGVAHDFNNLLVAILGNTELVLHNPRVPPAAARYLSEAVIAAQRASELCEQLLAYSGGGALELVDTDLSELLQEMSQFLIVSTGRTAELRLDLEMPGPVVRADAGQLRQVALNLILNAAEAIEEGHGLVTLTTGTTTLDRDFLEDTIFHSVREGKYALMEVSDTGIGMDEVTMQRMFDPFFTRKFTGRGLGLAAVLGIVREHHGTLRVHSDPGAGTTFQVFLPMDETEAHPEGDAEAPVGPRILVVDDEEAVRDTVRAMLQSNGYQVVVAENGDRAIGLLRTSPRPFSLVLLDVTMPGLSGPEVLEQCKALDASLPVVMMSGYAQSRSLLERHRAHLADYLKKPFRMRRLLDTVSAHARVQGGSS